MTLTQLLQSGSSLTLVGSDGPSGASGKVSEKAPQKSVVLDALRLIELTERTSAVMQSSEAGDILQRDALISIFRTFGLLNSIPVTVSLSVVSQDRFSDSVVSHIHENHSELVILPWHSSVDGQPSTTNYNPFEGIFGSKAASSDKVIYAQFIRRIFGTAPCDTALFIDRGLFPVDQANYGHHILLPFFGGPDDRLALSFVIQLCANPSITATIIRVRKTEAEGLTPTDTGETEVKAHPNLTVMSNSGFPDTIYAPASTETRLQSANEDSIALSRYTGTNRQTLSDNLERALTRVTFDDLATPQPLHDLVERANQERTGLEKSHRNLLIVAGRGRRMTPESHQAELRTYIQENQGKGGEMARTVGDVATAFMIGAKASVLVMQAALPSIKE